MSTGGCGHHGADAPPSCDVSVINVVPIDVLVNVALPPVGAVVVADVEPLSDNDSQAQDNVAENACYLANGEDN